MIEYLNFASSLNAVDVIVSSEETCLRLENAGWTLAIGQVFDKYPTVDKVLDFLACNEQANVDTMGEEINASLHNDFGHFYERHKSELYQYLSDLKDRFVDSVKGLPI